MPSLLASMVFGFVDSSTPLYSTVSKYPARPWHVPRFGMGKCNVLERALWAFVGEGVMWIVDCELDARDGIVDDDELGVGSAGFGCWKDHVVPMMGVTVGEVLTGGSDMGGLEGPEGGKW